MPSNVKMFTRRLVAPCNQAIRLPIKNCIGGRNFVTALNSAVPSSKLQSTILSGVHERNFKRFFGTTENEKLLKTLNAELEHERSDFEASSTIASYLSSSGWKFSDKEGDVNMILTKQVEGHNVTVEFQLVSPFQGEGDSEVQSEMTDFSMTIEKPSGKGVTFYCTTLQNDQKYRYMIGNIRCFESTEAKNLVSSYNGPEFEDLDDTLQESLDNWLSSHGLDGELCDFIDSCSIEKEQKEYILWLKNLHAFVKS